MFSGRRGYQEILGLLTDSGGTNAHAEDVVSTALTRDVKQHIETSSGKAAPGI
ncbi:hypothetical protein VFPPC_18111 [Pochonia chlamydosporia 170]|uniref:Uncharacterized protein n=1 Tax=Pochonia chlamydosporia 170 TaxID=1380566 RepID=A0A219APE5_METCM|nr:hypothetical protein VFPPC_18111 [Pochonia chlamydosporia 170]OWT42698.1 hypothetical protein VFPPC_18111 [Pochonia chlamydosporia 170]